MSIVWHDLECGRYGADLPLWRALADRYPGAVLDVGAGAGRVTLELARAGHPVTALDNDPELVDELRRRATGLEVTTVHADARHFELGQRFSLCIVPMQTIQLLGGPDGRGAFLHRAKKHLRPGGRLAVAVADTLDEFEVVPGVPGPLPDVCELDGVVYSSSPTAVRADATGFVLERRREVVALSGELTAEQDRLHIDRVAPEMLEREGRAAGLKPASREVIGPTRDYVGSVVVMLDA